MKKPSTILSRAASLSRAAWDRRYRQQARWTETLRRYALDRLALDANARVLEVGCGTGAVLSSMIDYANYRVYGIDRDLAYLAMARQAVPRAGLAGADALALPFPDGTFDAVFCHFFLLWVPQPAQALAEMVRVTRPGGSLLAFAEPDYGGRVDAPGPLEELGHAQAEALRRQGADPHLGRKLSGLFHAAGLREIETGVLGGQWQAPPTQEEMELEWATLRADLEGILSPERLDGLQAIDARAWEEGERVLFVPTFYAMGRK